MSHLCTVCAVVCCLRPVGSLAVCKWDLFALVPRLLLELLELLFDKFSAVASAHAVVLGYLQDAVRTPVAQQEDVKLYDMADVWVKIQDVLQVRAFIKAVCTQMACHL